MSIAEMMVMGTTGRKPRTIIPAAALVTISVSPIEKTETAVPGGGAATVVWTTATVSTPATVQSVTASAPHFVLFLQNSAATSSGDSAANPAKAYCVARSKIDCGMRS